MFIALLEFKIDSISIDVSSSWLKEIIDLQTRKGKSPTYATLFKAADNVNSLFAEVSNAFSLQSGSDRDPCVPFLPLAV